MAVDPLKEISEVTDDTKQQTQPEMLKNPAVPADYAVNMGFRIINQYLKRLNEYVFDSLRVEGFTILSTANNDYQIAAGKLIHHQYILEQGATETLDISTEFPDDGGDTGILYLHITEKRFKSDDATVTPGANDYGNIDPANDLRINAGSWYDTHNEWRFKFEWLWNNTGTLPTDSANPTETQFERYVKIADLAEVGSGVITTTFVMAALTKTYHEIEAYAIDHEARLTAVEPKGVTNGDAHDHNGGDGAQINHVNLSNVGSYTHANIDTHIDDATKHFVIDDASPGAAKAYSSTKIEALMTSLGVTNGDSHDHNGGDGATINHLNLSNIGSNNHSSIDAHMASTNNIATTTERGHVEKSTPTEILAGDSDKFIDASLLQSHESWQAPSYETGYAAISSGNLKPLQYRKLTNGMLQIVGSFREVSTPGSLLIFTLPVGRRPADDYTIPLIHRVTGIEVGQVVIATTGTFTVSQAVDQADPTINVILPLD